MDFIGCMFGAIFTLVIFFCLVFIVIAIVWKILYITAHVIHKINPPPLPKEVLRRFEEDDPWYHMDHSPDLNVTLDENARRETEMMQAMEAKLAMDIHRNTPDIHVNDGHIDSIVHTTAELGKLFLNG